MIDEIVYVEWVVGEPWIAGVVLDGLDVIYKVR